MRRSNLQNMVSRKLYRVTQSGWEREVITFVVADSSIAVANAFPNATEIRRECWDVVVIEPTVQIEAECKRLLQTGHKIDAIRYYRGKTGAYLRDAKLFIDELEGRK